MVTLIDAQQKWFSALAGMTGGADVGALLAKTTASSGGSSVSAVVSVKAPQPGSGGETGDDSWISFAPTVVLWVDGQVRANQSFDHSTSVKLMAGERGQLLLKLKINGMQDNVSPGGNEHFKQDVEVSWDVSADGTGALTIEPPQETIGAPTEGTYYRLEGLNPGKGTAFVQISPVIAGGMDSGNIGASAGVSIGVGRTAPPPKIKETFRIDITVKVPDPKGTVEIGNEIDVLTFFDYVVGPFKVASADVLTAGTVTKQVYQILHKMLPAEAKAALLQGKLPGDEWPDGTKTGEGAKIEVHGYTSNTDSESHNFTLSKKRAQAVLAAFKSLGVPSNVFSEAIPHGEWEVNDDAGMVPTDDKRDERESEDWRKVVLKIKHGMHVKAT
jgi:OmpA family